MSIATVLAWLESSKLAEAIRTSSYLFAIIESFHVIGLTLVFGTITIVDLRLLGIGSTRRPFTRIASETLKWTWVAFVLTAATGLLLFITMADVYYHNFYFRSKMILIALSAVNMLIFKFTVSRWVHRWDRDQAAPVAARAAAIVSLVLWISVIFCGRWIGFSTQL
jgi:hypothetical protein